VGPLAPAGAGGLRHALTPACCAIFFPASAGASAAYLAGEVTCGYYLGAAVMVLGGVVDAGGKSLEEIDRAPSAERS